MFFYQLGIGIPLFFLDMHSLLVLLAEPKSENTEG